MGAYVSVLDLFSIGIGPSSSHTVGPMRAAGWFAASLADDGQLASVHRLRVRLLGSLGATGVGHRTPDAVVVGLGGHQPETCDPRLLDDAWASLAAGATVLLAGAHPVVLAKDDVQLAPLTRLPRHPNAMTVEAFDADGQLLRREVYYSVGGGTVVREGDAEVADGPAAADLPFGFTSAAELLASCASSGIAVHDVALANETALHGRDAVLAGIDAVWAVMSQCIDIGLRAEGSLPGALAVRRRASSLRRQLEAGGDVTPHDWLHAYAMAVNEQNAAGERVVTAPTNGAAGIVPAVLRHLLDTLPGELDEQSELVHRYLLTATAIGSLFASNASISGAEAGCQGEVGSASAMAAAGACALMGGTPEQVENAAEIAMEHNLGLTCDPVGGLVQVPCIERNAMGATKALTAARMAQYGDGRHVVSLDTVIETMRQTGLDMSDKYKETSTGGLAVNVVEC